MRLAKVLVGAAVLSVAFAGSARAGFTPPSNITPYLPAANVVTVTYLKDSGVFSIYMCNQTHTTILVPKGTSMAAVVLKASENCAFTRLLADSGLANSTDLASRQAATSWFMAVIDPYYKAATAAVSVKSAAVRMPARSVRLR